MRPVGSHPPESRRLLVVGSVGRIVSGLELREPLEADGVDLRDAVLEEGSVDFFVLDLPVAETAFQGDKLALLESPGELGEVP
jgi:hypothetical protein